MHGHLLPNLCDNVQNLFAIASQIHGIGLIGSFIWTILLLSLLFKYLRIFDSIRLIWNFFHLATIEMTTTQISQWNPIWQCRLWIYEYCFVFICEAIELSCGYSLISFPLKQRRNFGLAHCSCQINSDMNKTFQSTRWTIFFNRLKNKVQEPSITQLIRSVVYSFTYNTSTFKCAKGIWHTWDLNRQRQYRKRSFACRLHIVEFWIISQP